MGKNQKFNAKYTIEVNGITTNGFLDGIIDNIIRSAVQAIDINYKQVDITINKEN